MWANIVVSGHVAISAYCSWLRACGCGGVRASRILISACMRELTERSHYSIYSQLLLLLLCATSWIALTLSVSVRYITFCSRHRARLYILLFVCFQLKLHNGHSLTENILY